MHNATVSASVSTNVVACDHQNLSVFLIVYMWTLYKCSYRYTNQIPSEIG